MSKPVLSVRIDEELLKKARESGLDIKAIVEASLAKAVKEKKCPYCGVKTPPTKKN